MRNERYKGSLWVAHIRRGDATTRAWRTGFEGWVKDVGGPAAYIPKETMVEAFCAYVAASNPDIEPADAEALEKFRCTYGN